MSSAEEYRQYARECLESAARAPTEPQRLVYLEMARTWEKAALALSSLSDTDAKEQTSDHYPEGTTLPETI